MDKYGNQLVEVLMKTRDKSLMRDLLEGMLTRRELEEIPKRLEIVKQLLTGKPQLNIAQDLGVGIATITRGSRELKLGRFKALRKYS